MQEQATLVAKVRFKKDPKSEAGDYISTAPYADRFRLQRCAAGWAILDAAGERTNAKSLEQASAVCTGRAQQEADVRFTRNQRISKRLAEWREKNLPPLASDTVKDGVRIIVHDCYGGGIRADFYENPAELRWSATRVSLDPSSLLRKPDQTEPDMQHCGIQYGGSSTCQPEDVDRAIKVMIAARDFYTEWRPKIIERVKAYSVEQDAAYSEE